MLDEVDQALRAFLAPHLPQAATLTFERPGDGGAAPPGNSGPARSTRQTPSTGQTPVVSLFLYQVCEDTTGRNASWTDVRDGSRKVVSRREPVRRYQLSYVVTVHAESAAVEHRTLSQVLAAFAGANVVPANCLSGSLAECRLPVELMVGSPAGTERARAVWATLGATQRALLDLTVTAPLAPALSDVDAPATSFNLHFTTDATPPSRSGPAEAAPERRFTTVRLRENRSPLPPRLVHGPGLDEPQNGDAT